MRPLVLSFFESVAWGKVPRTQREHVLSVFVVPETVKCFLVFYLITPLHPPQELGGTVNLVLHLPYLPRLRLLIWKTCKEKSAPLTQLLGVK